MKKLQKMKKLPLYPALVGILALGFVANSSEQALADACAQGDAATPIAGAPLPSLG